MGSSNEVACRRTSRQPRQDLDLGPVDEAAENASLVVEESRTIFSATRTVDEYLPAHPEDRAGVT
jgi:hypothetical protein